LAYKLDVRGTAESFSSGRFQDRNSELDLNGGEHLAGVDIGIRRHEIYLRDKGCCVVCGKWLPENGTIWKRAHWAHKETEFGRRDNSEDGGIKCYNCHIVKEHAREVQLKSVPGISDNSK
jgi:hypothetical protein